jgi:hypothetical protein
MPTKRGGYWSRAGVKLPSVTTICGRFKESGALIQWAYKQGREHQAREDRGLPAPASLYAQVEDAANVGTLVHGMAEDRVCRRDPWVRFKEATRGWSQENINKAERGFRAFENWLTMTRIEIVYTEAEMVSEALQCGGTLDWIGRLDGTLVLGDFKTSSRVYPEHLVQIAAYREMWNETHPTEQLAPGAHILQFGKDAGDFSHHHYPELEDAIDQFRTWVKSYALDERIKKRAM